MSCGGNMMRASLSPLAHLVDGVAERWSAVNTGDNPQRETVRQEILRAFRLGDRDELTFHGHNYLLTIRRAAGDPASSDGLRIETHEIARS